MGTRIIIADDHPIFRQGLVSVIRDTGEFDVVGEAENGEQALDLLDRARPSVAIVDIAMPLMDGLEVIRAAATRKLRTAFVVLTMYKEEEYFREALSLGVKGYLLKESAASELLHCLNAVVAGRHYVSAAFSEFLIARAASPQGRNNADPLGLLSPTERRILKMLGENRTSKEIADELHVSFRTVNNHRAHICEKLKLEGHNKLLQYALEHKGKLEPGEIRNNK